MKMKKLAAMVAAMAVSAMSIVSVNAFAEKQSAYEFYLGGSYAGHQFHSPDWVKVDVPADGTYTVTYEGAGETNGDDFILYLDSNVNVWDYGTTEGGNGITDGTIKITIDSVLVDGQPIAYTMSDGAVRTSDDGNNLRVNVYNQWAGTKDVDPNLTVTESVGITFTVSGLFDAEEPTTEATTTTEAAATTTTEGGSTTAAGTTTKSGSTTKAAGSTTKAAASTTTTATTTNTATGDNSGIAVAVAALAVAGGALVASRKRK